MSTGRRQACAGCRCVARAAVAGVGAVMQARRGLCLLNSAKHETGKVGKCMAGKAEA